MARKKKAIRARVTVYPRPELRDPEGEAIAAALTGLGFDSVAEVRAGRSFEIVFVGGGKKAAPKLLREMCDKLLANPMSEDCAVELLGESEDPAPKEPS